MVELNGLRLACSISMRSSMHVRIFLIGSAVACARKRRPGHAQPDDAETLITAVLRHGGKVRVCSTCVEDQEDRADLLTELVDGVTLSTLDELTRWITEAERVLVF
ncbi:MAG: DsrE family protein [Steroidobacteraceae bacterium]